MPNWCNNVLEIKGEEEELNRFKEFAKDGERLLSNTKFIPYPKERQEMIEEYNNNKTLQENWNNGDMYWFNRGGYEWCINNWGTKWNITNIYLDIKKQLLEYSFDSAWNSIEPVIYEMGKMFPLLTFDLHWEESGVGIQGHLLIEKGCYSRSFIKECDDDEGWDDDEGDE